MIGQLDGEYTEVENHQCLTCSGRLLQYQGKLYPICPITTIGINRLCQACPLNCDIWVL